MGGLAISEVCKMTEIKRFAQKLQKRDGRMQQTLPYFGRNLMGGCNKSSYSGRNLMGGCNKRFYFVTVTILNLSNFTLNCSNLVL